MLVEYKLGRLIFGTGSRWKMRAPRFEKSKPLHAQNRVIHLWPKQYTPPLYFCVCGGGRSSSPNHTAAAPRPPAGGLVGVRFARYRSLRSPTLRPPANPRVLGFALMGGRNVSRWHVRRNIKKQSIELSQRARASGRRAPWPILPALYSLRYCYNSK